MRFRLEEDERRYLTLKAEVYLRLTPHLPKLTLSEVMRNLAKMESMSYGEGIKQGMAVAIAGEQATETSDGGEGLPAIAAHASFYGDAHTPLVRVEQKALPHTTHPWLDALPVAFPPQTLAEALAAYGPTLEPAANTEKPGVRMVRVAPDPGVERLIEAFTPEADRETLDLQEVLGASRKINLPGGVGGPIESLTATQRVRDALDAEGALDEQIEEESKAAAERGEDRAQSPAFLDRVRGQIQHEMQGGWLPKTWPELIMRLHLSMQTDAAALDLQLAGEQGRAVLDQCGLHSIGPGMGVMVDGGGRFAGTR